MPDDKRAKRSRREFLRTTARLTSAALASSGLAGTPFAADFQAPSRGQQAVGARRLLLRGGTVLSMDPAVGDFLSADVLIDGTKIADVRPGIPAAGATTIDASNMIVIPGLVDAHRHGWQNVFRRVIPNADLQQYGDFANALIPAMRAEDVYIANLITGLAALHTGVTTLLDYSHISKTAAISDAAIKGHVDSGIRAVYAYAAPRNLAASLYPQDIRRLKKQFFSSADQLITLRLGTALDAANYALAREVGVGIHSDGIFGVTTPARASSSPVILEMAKAGLLGPDVTLIHGTGFSDEVLRVLAERGVCLVLAPTSDAVLRGLGNSLTPIQGIVDHGLLRRTGLSVDVEVSLSPDLFAQMRAVFTIQRLLANIRLADGDTSAPPNISAREVLTLATIGGATASGLAGRTGTLTPGKAADVVLIRGNDLTLGPLNNAYGSVVIGAGPDNVDTVIVGGRIRKSSGRLVGIDEAGVMRQAQASRDFLGAATGLWKRDDIVKG
jgi:5-methylthioadenosine/S-adenosylhomocysteine deaminase